MNIITIKDRCIAIMYEITKMEIEHKKRTEFLKEELNLLQNIIKEPKEQEKNN